MFSTRVKWVGVYSSGWRFFTLLFACLLVSLMVLSPHGRGVKAQEPTATWTPAPGQIFPTFGPVITNTPNLMTATPAPTEDFSGCPASDFDDELLADGWAYQCSRCVRKFNPTVTPFLRDFQLVIPDEVGTFAPDFPTNEPTLPPIYSPATLPPVATNTPAPMASPTPGNYELYFDFRVSGAGWSIEPWSTIVSTTNPVADGTWTSGLGFGTSTTVNYEPGYTGEFLLLHHIEGYDPAVDAIMENLTAFVVYHSALSGVSGNSSFSGAGFCCGAAGGVRGDHYNAYTSPVDWRDAWMWTTYLGSGHGYIQGLAITWTGAPYEPGGTPEPTNTPTPSVDDIVFDCAVPSYKDIDTPIADIDIDNDVIFSECYRIVPEINSTDWGLEIELVGIDIDLDVGLRVDGVDLCVDWIAFPTIQFFGIVFAVDLILIIPIAYVVRRLLTF